MRDGEVDGESEGVEVGEGVREVVGVVDMVPVRDAVGVRLTVADCDVDPVLVTLLVLVTLVEPVSDEEPLSLAVAVEDSEGDELGVMEMDPELDRDREPLGVGVTVTLLLAVPVKEGDGVMVLVTDTVTLTVALGDSDRDWVEDRERVGVADAETEEEGDMRGVGDTDGVTELEDVAEMHSPPLVSSEKACRPRAAAVRVPVRLHTTTTVTMEDVCGVCMVRTRRTSWPASAGRPLGFSGAPQPPPRGVTSEPLALSYGPKGTPSTHTVNPSPAPHASMASTVI